MRAIFLFLIFTTSLIYGEMEKVYINHNDELRHYLIYKPINFNKNKSTKLVIGIHGYNGTASGFESEVTGGFNKLADKYNFIAVYPESVNFYDGTTLVNTFNDIVRQTNEDEISKICLSDEERYVYPKYPDCDRGRCGWAPCVDDAAYIKSLIDKFELEFNLSDVYIIGNSSGGTFVNSFMCKYPESITTGMSINGMARLGFSCVPDYPVNFISYASLNDRSVPPVGNLSLDGLFYDTQETLINKWVEKFDCKNLKQKSYIHNERFEENIFSECNNQIVIMSILNLDSDHMWPEAGYDKETGTSSYTNFGTCVTEIQSEYKIPKCYRTNDRWGSEYILEKLFSLDHSH